MEITYAELSITGPIREVNEDALGSWIPDSLEGKREIGSAILIADGVGGHGRGEIASRLAIGTATRELKEVKPDTPPKDILARMFARANTSVYDLGMEDRSEGRMATTLTVSLFRHNEVTIGHVGDCRVYLVRNGAITRITTDHSYVGMQLKMGLISEREAMTSDLRSMLTKSIGQNLIVGPDIYTSSLYGNDILVQCSDGLHGWVTESEIRDIVLTYPPKEACEMLTGIASKRNSEDNVSLQVVRVEQVEAVALFMGKPYFVPQAAAPVSREPQPGQLLDGRFEITDIICRGGTNTVYKAIDKTNQAAVALKVPFAQYREDTSIEENLQREEEIGKSMSHPSILRVIPVEEKSRPYLAMEYLEGQTLASLLNAIRPLPVADAVKIASRLADALDYMHRRRMNVVHRDLKPDNIMICNDGSIRIMDFGIAKATGQRAIKFAGYVPAIGTPDYLAPEQVRGERGDERTDIYSLGAILYEMATGSPPFDGPSAYVVMNARLNRDPVAPRKLSSKISPEVEEVILHAMERNPDGRYNSAAEMRQELDALDKVIVTQRHARLVSAEPLRESSKTSRFFMLLILLPFLLVVAFLVLYFLFSHY